jgi:hypothetical protein
MAIDKAVENEYGAEFSYHKLREVRIINDDKIGVQLTLTVYSWLNKQARVEGKQPTVRQCIINDADFAMTPFYALLKAKFPEFSAGADDFNNDFKPEREANVRFVEQTGRGELIKRWEEKDDFNGGNE